MTLLLTARALPPQDSNFSPQGEQIPAPDCLTWKSSWEGGYSPCTPEDHAIWLKDIMHWRMERLIRTGFSEERYNLPVLRWTQSSFIQPQMMVQDRYFYDPARRQYTVDRYLDDVQRRYGGIDSVLIWPTYPNLGIDNRNQHDMIRCFPGGITGVKQMIAAFHGRGVRVLFPMMMWDQGTRKPDKPWPDEIAELMAELGADGINGDTQDGVPLVFSLAAEKVGHPLAFEPESGPSDEALAWNIMGWGYYQFPFAPLPDRYKWLEPRHMVHISDRWSRNKSNDLQYAFFNGIGFESWENIWGIWNGLTQRDAEEIRRIAVIERAIPEFLISQQWEPLFPMSRYGVFGSKWPLQNQTIWTIVNRNGYDTYGRQMQVPSDKSLRFFDLYHGDELNPESDASGNAYLKFPIEAKGYAAILATTGEPDLRFQKLMSEMKQLTSTPLANYSDQWRVETQQIVPILETKTVASTPPGMIKIPEADFVFTVRGIEIEGPNDVGVDVEYPWENSPRRFHEYSVHVKPFYMDKFPVTNSEFKKFIEATHYHPDDALHFLQDWKNGTYPSGWDNRPVTWVSLEDARAYAIWKGKRLPHEWEWQYAAQGTDGRLYPWGNQWDSSAVPEPEKGRTMGPPDSVDAHPKGASPFGVMDLVGNVWQWTEEFVDDHTRSAILRGGSHYQPQGSIWYFPQAYRLNEHGKLLLMSPSMDRSGTVGFRLAQDAGSRTGEPSSSSAIHTPDKSEQRSQSVELPFLCCLTGP
jgi:iron(II)-dependent oxidoreductase